MADDSAKLSTLFGKKKKKAATTVNANVIAKEQSRAESAAAASRTAASASAAAAAAAAAAPASPKARGNKATAMKAAASSPASGPAATPVKNLSELMLGDKTEKTAFQWAKQPKKYKDTTEAVRVCDCVCERKQAYTKRRYTQEGVARTWEEQDARNRQARRINLSSERAFPTLGADLEKAQLNTMKAPTARAVEVKNAWGALHHDEDSD